MLEIAGGVVIGGVMLFLLWVFLEPIVWIVLAALGTWVAIEFFIGLYRFVLKINGHNLGVDPIPDGLFGLAILALMFEVFTGAENIRELGKLISNSAIFDKFKKKKIEKIKVTQPEPSRPIVVIAKSRRERAQEILDRYYGTKNL